MNGDVLVNLNGKTGDFSLALNQDAVGIGSFKLSGNLEGSLVSGGSINNVTISGSTTSILTGSATSGFAFDIGGGQPQGQGTLGIYTPPAKLNGPNITNLNLGAIDLIHAGDGGIGKAGGSVSNVTIQNDTDGFTILAGSGGNASGGVINGGAGGSINKVVVFGVVDATLNDTINLIAGDGGDGTAAGTGGAGGNVTSVWVGYETKGSTLIKSTDYLGDFTYVFGGSGGDGKTGGRGGSLSDINIRVAPSDLAILGPEIGLFAGDGGDALAAGGKSGDGGNVNKFFIVNAYDDAPNPASGVAVAGGDAGDGTLGNLGGRGGFVSNGIVISKAIEMSGGDGASALLGGGIGGTISNIQIAFPGDAALTQFKQPETNIDGVLAEEIVLLAGNGGSAATKGKAGAGGDITNISAPDTNLRVLTVTAGNGGNSADGAGGNGGRINSVRLESDRDSTFDALTTITAGNGGNGTKSGGLGGDLQNSYFFLTDASILASAGNGGNGGVGGNGGSIRGASFVAVGEYLGVPGTVTVLAGNGGGASANFKAGNGGSILGTKAEKVTVESSGDITVFAGGGGAPTSGFAGSGGSLAEISLLALDGTASVFAAAGAGGFSLTAGKGAAGGNITSINASADVNITILAGNGSSGVAGGGNGGSVQNLSFGGSNIAAPTGNVTVQAGQGASGTNLGGNGGNLNNVVGFSSSTLTSTIVFEAGKGGDSDRNGGKGGSINNFTILGGAAEFSVLAGDAGKSNVSGSGGAGGNISGLTVAPDLVLRDIAAGNGGDSTAGKGGVGGTVRNVNTTGAIGVMSGSDFGFGQAGGIFAGLGGTGGKSNGLAGNVTNITAQSIASIVAGRGAAPGYVNVVEGIILNGSTAPTLNVGGGFSNFNTANMIGSSSLADPSVAGGANFHYESNLIPASYTPGTTASWNPTTDIPLDGLVAALVFKDWRNVAASAWLRPDSSGNPQIITRTYETA